MEGAPRSVTSAGADGRAAEHELARQAILDELEELDGKIVPLRGRLNAGEKVHAELEPLLDKRGELVRKMEGRETKR